MGWKSRMRKRIVSVMLLFTFLSGLCAPIGTLAAEKQSDILYVFDLEKFIEEAPNTKVGYDYLKVASALQGLANREQPQIYYLYEDNVEAQKQGVDIDEYWLENLRGSGRFLEDFEVKEITDFYQLLKQFEHIVKGVVLWDEKVPATANVASTIAGVEDLIPVRFDESKDSVYTDLIINRKLFGQVKKNLVGKFTLENEYIPNEKLEQPIGEECQTATRTTGSTKNDAYIWAKEQYLDKGLTSKEMMAYTLDGWSKQGSQEAQFIRASLPEKMNPGQVQEISVVLKNNSKETWTRAGNYRIAAGQSGGNQFAFQNPQFGGEQLDAPLQARIYLGEDQIVNPGDEVNVKVSIVAPTQTGEYRLNLGVVHDGVRWLNGEFEYQIIVTEEELVELPEATEGEYAVMYAIAAPEYIGIGDLASVDVTLYNNGTTTWTSDEYQLNYQTDTKNGTVNLQNDVAPKEKVILTVPISTDQAGTIRFSAVMQKNQETIGDAVETTMHILPDCGQSGIQFDTQEACDAIVYSVSIPEKIGVGQEAPVVVKVMNTGNTTWSNQNQDISVAGPGKWGLEAIAPNSIDMVGPSNARFYFPPDVTIAPGETYTFEEKVIRRDNGEEFPLAVQAVYRMIYDGLADFGTVIGMKSSVVEEPVTEYVMQKYESPKYTKVLVDWKPKNKEVLLEISDNEFVYTDLFNAGVINADYFIQNRAFFFDLSPDDASCPIDDRNQPVGTDVQTLKKLLYSQTKHTENDIFRIIGFVPWHMKYTTAADPEAGMDPVPAEWKMIDIFSSYGGETDADAMSMVGLANASVFSKIPLNELHQKNQKGEDSHVVYEKDTKYVTFYMGDYDCGAWTSGVLPLRWDDKRRGEYPLAWPINGSLSKRVPQVYNYLYETATENDYFVAGDNGTGYLNPMWLENTESYQRPDGLPDILDTWKQKNIENNKKFDLDISGFLIGGNAPLITERVQQVYSETTPDGVVYQGGVLHDIYINEEMGTETPFISYNDTVMTDDANTMASSIAGLLSVRKQFFSLRSVIASPSVIYDAINIVKETYPELKFEVVDPYTLMRLYKENNGETPVPADVSYDMPQVTEETKITIDGIANEKEWADAEEIVVSSESDIVKKYGFIWNGFSGEDDLKSVYKLKWDKENLYVLEQRQDNVLSFNGDDQTACYTSDASMLFLDLNNRSSAGYLAGDYSIHFSASSIDGKPVVFLREGHNNGPKDNILMENVTAKATCTENGYTFEMAIPWSNLQVQPFIPENDTVVGMSFIAIDNDGAPNIFKGQIMWVGNGDDQNNWADMKFVGKPTSSVDKKALDALIEECSGLREKDYTVESWKIFSETLINAKNVSADEQTTQEEVDSAKEALKAAKESLEKKKGDNTNNNKPTDKLDSSSENAGKGIPDTGDDTGILPLLAACVVSIMAVAGVMARRRNRHL